ncbi:MAG: methyltransferase domain-containing protein [Dehalococcoidia bacterium]
MVQTASTYFDSTATKYDDFALRANPAYEAMLAEVERCLPERAQHVLELGCGTGALTVRLVRRYPAADIVAVDGASEMLAIARQRLEETQVSQVTLAVRSFEDLELADRSFDLIASNMSLHHVEEKVALYGRLRRALAPGGIFVLGDELLAEVPYMQQRNWDGWLDFARGNGVTEAKIAETISHMERFDHYESLPAQLALLQGAGFDPVDCVWRYQNYAVFVAQAA